MSRRWFLLATCLLCLASGRAQEALAPAMMETVRTAEGTFLVWYRTPAVPADLEMAVPASGLVLNSFVYRVRDRKRRDLLRYARIVFSTIDPTEQVIAFYAGVLGEGARQYTKKATGETLLSAGGKEDARLVTISPQEGFSKITLQRVQQFTIPPRVYTESEQRVIRVLKEIADTYRTAQRVAYTVQQEHLKTAGEGEEAPASPVISWTVDFTRPGQLAASARSENDTIWQVTSRDGALEIIRPDSPPERRPLADGLTLEALPEVFNDDIAARLMLGDALITPAVDYLALEAVKDAPVHRRAEMVLTFPDQRATLRLLLDMQRKVILRSEIVADMDEGRLRIARTYADLVLTPASPEPGTAPRGPETPAPSP